MNDYSFPDRPPRPGSTIPPTTINNVAHLLNRGGIACRYNEVKKRVEIEVPGQPGTLDNRDNVTLSHVVSLASQAGMPTGHVPDFVDAVADRNAYNPAADWITSKQWDRVDRLPVFLDTIKVQPDYPSELKRLLVHKWMRSAAAAPVMPEFKARGVLTLQGRQSMGKTSWVKRLVTGPEPANSLVKLGHHLDAGNKDSVITAVSHWLVEIGELDSSFKRDIARLKSFLTEDTDIVRRPYGRRDVTYRRRTVFLATVNEAHFLVDQTGNSRWWTVACSDLDYDHDVDMQQLYAQLLKEVRDGAPWWLNPGEEELLSAWNARHQAISAIADRLDSVIDHDRIGGAGLPAMTATQVLALIEYDRPTNGQARECGAVLREVLGEPRRINGREKWRVPVKEATAADIAPEKRPAVPAGKHPPQSEPEEIF